MQISKEQKRQRIICDASRGQESLKGVDGAGGALDVGYFVNGSPIWASRNAAPRQRARDAARSCPELRSRKAPANAGVLRIFRYSFPFLNLYPPQGRRPFEKSNPTKTLARRQVVLLASVSSTSARAGPWKAGPADKSRDRPPQSHSYANGGHGRTNT